MVLESRLPAVLKWAASQSVATQREEVPAAVEAVAAMGSLPAAQTAVARSAVTVQRGDDLAAVRPHRPQGHGLSSARPASPPTSLADALVALATQPPVFVGLPPSHKNTIDWSISQPNAE